MPVYQFRCTSCEHVEDEIRCIEQRNEPKDCKECFGAMKPEVAGVRVIVRNPAAGPPRKKFL
jgi:putative FmdB family regulatory protein